MPNILITLSCNLSCEYCFAMQKLRESQKHHMSLENVRKVIAFLQRDRYPCFRIMGGEPTLHPHFQDIIQLALQEGMRVDLLSNATWQSRYNELFKKISPNYLLFLLNIDHPDKYPPKQFSRIEKNLNVLAGRKGISLSFNIFESEPKYEYIFNLTSKYDIRNVRLSFSLPIYGEQNTYLKLEQYEELVPFIMEFIRRGESQNVSIHLDNAIPLCIFNLENTGELLLKGMLDLKRNARCRPIIDIGPDLTVWYCFCLSKLYNRNLEEFDSLEEIQEYYDKIMKPYQDYIFPMEKCYACHYRHTWGCQGGCITFSIWKNKQRLEKKVLSKETEKDVFALAKDVKIEQYNIPRKSYFVVKVSSKESFEISSSFKQLLELLNGQTTIKEVLDKFFADNKRTTDAVENFTNEIMRENLKEFLVELSHKDFLVTR